MVSSAGSPFRVHRIAAQVGHLTTLWADLIGIRASSRDGMGVELGWVGGTYSPWQSLERASYFLNSLPKGKKL